MQLQCRYSSADLILWVLRGRVNEAEGCVLAKFECSCLKQCYWLFDEFSLFEA
jgi:hypothetical protein